MRHRVGSAELAKLGLLAFAIALTLPTLAGARTFVPRTEQADRPVTGPDGELSAAPRVLAEARLELPEDRLQRTLVPSVRPPLAPLSVSGRVMASWYGPGFYGNRTACGVVYTAETVGVAHRTLPCGTRLALSSVGGVALTVTVIDRGPYVAGRTLDLSYATKTALACGDLCWVEMRIVD